MRIDPITSLDEIRGLLEHCQLQVSDISGAAFQKFYGLHEQDALIAVVGLEALGNNGLLRSLAVARDQRGRGLASALTRHVEQQATAQGMHALYLLTTTAAGFFRQRGYLECAREDVPTAMRASSQFSVLCPASAILLKKPITP